MTLRFTNLKQFDRDLARFTNKIEADAGQVVRKVAFDIFRGVVEKTPVDTGWARASWNISFDKADLSVPPKPQGGEAEAQALNDKQELKLQATLQKFPVIWIVNNLSYIQYLEAGHSKQSGKGFMVQRTIADVATDVRNLLKGL